VRHGGTSLSTNCCKKSEGGENNNNVGSGKRQPRSRAPIIGMEFVERKKKPKKHQIKSSRNKETCKNDF
jgi:hypothetical protein